MIFKNKSGKIYTFTEVEQLSNQQFHEFGIKSFYEIKPID